MARPENFNSTLKRCDLYDNPYNAQLQAHPAIVKQRQAVHQENDTLSSAQGKLEKELFETYFLNNNKVLIVGKVGKYAFLALMLPAFLFFYGVPKWILSEAGPRSLLFIKKIVFKAGSRIAEAASHAAFGALSLIRKATDPILNFINARIEKGRELYLRTKQKCINLAKWPKGWAAKLFRPIIHSFQQISESLSKARQITSRFIEAMQRYSLRVREALIRLPQKAAEFLPSLSAFGKQMLSQLANRMQPIIDMYQKLNAKISSMAEAVKNFTGRVVKPVKEQVQKLAQFSLDQFNAVKEPIADWMSAKKEKIARLVNSVIEKVDHVRERIQTKLQPLTEKMDEWMSKLKENPGQLIHNMIPQPVLSLFTPLAMAFNFVREVPAIFKGKKGSTQDKTKKFQQKIKKAMIRLNEKFFALMRRNSAKIKPLLLKIARKISQLLIKGARLAKEMLMGGFFLLRMLLAWMKILLRHGLFLLRETCSAWFPAIYNNSTSYPAD